MEIAPERPAGACGGQSVLHLTPIPEDAPFPEPSGAIPAAVEGGAWDTSCRDWEERLLEGRSLVPDLPLYEAEAAKAVRVFKRLRLSDVIGTPTMAEACAPWYLKIVEALFGSLDPDTNV